MVTTVVNLQRKIGVDVRGIREFARRLPLLIDEARKKAASVAIVSDARMVELNEMFRGKSATTDVLSFVNDPDEFAINIDPDAANFLGDIVISAEQAEKQAAENGLTVDLEIKQLVLHGFLHLCGYDHETDDGQMNRRELELRDKIGI